MFIPSVYRTTYRIAQEKELRTKESMYMMGLKPLPYWLSWFAYYVIVTTVLTVISVSLMKFVFSSTNIFIVFLVVYSFGLSLFGFMVAIQALFNKARVAAIVTTTIYLVLMLPFLLFGQGARPKPKILLWGISLLPPSSLGLTNASIINFESSRLSVDFESWGLEYKNWSVKSGIKIQFCQIFIWLVIGAYLEAVAPREYGKPLKPWFMFMPSFWRPKRV